MNAHSTGAATSPSGLRRRFLALFRTPSDTETQNRKRVFDSVFIGTFCVSAVICLLLLMSYAMLHHGYVLPRLLWSTLGVVVLVGIITLYRTFKAYVLSAHLLLLYYTVIATIIVVRWGINTPFGILLFALVIILGGILIKARYALYAASMVTLILLAVQFTIQEGIHIPDTVATKSGFGDVIGYCTGFTIIAIVSWLYGTQMERSLHKAAKAEAALEAEKQSLEIKVAQRTAALEQTRIEELEQAYKFAELGNLSTALLHDLANYLTVLTLDIKDLHGQHNSATLARANETISYIDKMVEDVRDQVHGKSVEAPFSVVDRTTEVIGILQHKARQAGVVIDWERPKSQPEVYGDRTRFNQLAAIIIGNAIDASEHHKGSQAVVSVAIEHRDHTVALRVSNSGTPLSADQEAQLFKPFHSTKKQGMGIGLFLAKQMAERHFKGTIALDKQADQTTFRIVLPEHI